MHIAEGVLSAPVLGLGWLGASAGVAVGLWRTDYERIPRVAVFGSAFFVASLIHVPLPPSSAHLILNGLMGVVLGWAAFPAVLIALALQAVFFGFGGITALGANTVVMAAPAVACYLAFGRSLRRAAAGGTLATWLGFGAGALSIVLSGALAAGALLASGGEFWLIAHGVFLAHLPIMVVEGIVTACAVGFLAKVRPELLDAPVLSLAGKGAIGA